MNFFKAETILKEVKVKPTLEEALAIVSASFMTPGPRKVDAALEAKIFEDMAAIKDVSEFLEGTLAADMYRYFNAQPEDQALAKGAFMRTSYFYDKIRQSLTKK